MILLLIVLLTSTVCTVKSDSHNVTVRPTDSSDPFICGDYAPCDTLSNLLYNNPNIFSDKSDLKLNFLEGTHVVNYLSNQIKVGQKKKIIWHGKNSIIMCLSGLIFIFSNTENLEIQGLTFSKCGNCYYNSQSEKPVLHKNISAALFLNNVNLFHCKTVTITNSKGYGLIIYNHLGNAQIQNSSFLHNNKDCQPNSHDSCIGGNIALYFLTEVNALKKLINISITGCTIEGGRDLSSKTIRICMKRRKQTPSVTAFRANGLAVVFLQKTYRVRFQIHKTKFLNNTSHKHPAVLVYDHSEVTNKVEFQNTNFSNGSLLIFKLSNNNMPSKFFIIKNCLLNATHVPAIHICVKPVTKNRLPKLNFKSSFNYSSTLVTVTKSVIFSKYSPHHRGPPTVVIEALQNGRALWKYGESNSKEINTAELSDCKFNPSSGLSSALLIKNCRTVIWSCTFSHFRKTAVIAANSTIIVDGQNVLDKNQGRPGGGLILSQSLMFLRPSGKIYISRNNANFGGGVFATPIKPNLKKTDSGLYSFCTVAGNVINGLVFENNNSSYGGHSIFGGKFSNCSYNCTKKGQCQVMPNTAKSQQLPQNIKIIPFLNESNTEISSPSTRICLCKNDEPTSKCDIDKKKAFPGQEFNVSLIALGEFNGSAAVIVTARPNYFTLNIDNRLHFLPIRCKTFSYSVHSPRKHDRLVTVTLRISKETPKALRSKNTKNFKIKIKLLPCPPGLSISRNEFKCDCTSFILKFDMTCDSKRGLVHIKNKQWISFYGNTTVITRSYPLDYLTPGDKVVNLSETDEQCDFNRGGVLCGACRTNFSVVLGSSNCKECSNVYLLLIIPFALAGVALVVLLLKCNLTVSAGHINGIIFYANIVQVNKALLLPQKEVAYEIFSTFISWLNLDLGIETCFFANMDTYAKVCLQFVFPVYLWIIVGLIILAAHCSSRMGRLIGDNSVPVLATLLLLSYTKLLRTIIAAVAFAYIEFEDGSRTTVWEKDGNVQYLHSKHIGLFLVALLFLFVYIIPLIMLVLLAPCLQAWSHHRAFRWVNQLKPFLDAYQGPYNDKFRFWTGLLLLTRLVLFVVYASNYTNDYSISFFWTVAVTALLISVLLRKAVYKHQIANWIELLSLVNIVILCSVSWLSKKTEYHQWRFIGTATTYTSAAVIMLTFFFIILYQQTRLHFCVCTKRHKPREQGVRTDGDSTVNVPTFSVVELEESNQLKEPLLDSD